MRLFLSAALGALLAGCAAAPSPMQAGLPGQMRQVMTVSSTAPSKDEPAFCLASVRGPAALERATLLGRATALGQSTYFRSFTNIMLVTAPEEACDVYLKLNSDGDSAQSLHTLEASSAYDEQLLLVGSASGNVARLGRLLRSEFQPGQPAFARLAKTKAAHKGAK